MRILPFLVLRAAATGGFSAAAVLIVSLAPNILGDARVERLAARCAVW